MRLVLDTNVAVSALLWQGVPRKLIEAAQAGAVTPVATVPLLDELRGVLEREEFARQLAAPDYAVTCLTSRTSTSAATNPPTAIAVFLSVDSSAR